LVRFQANHQKLIKSILKFSLLFYNNLIINRETFQNKPELIKEIENKLTDEDLNNFAEIFLKNHNYLFKNLEESDLNAIQQEENPISKIHYLWNFEFDKQQKWLKDTLGFETGSLSEEVSEAIRHEQTLFNKFYGSYPSFDNSMLNKKFLPDYGLPIPPNTNVLEKLLNSQTELYKANQEQLKLSNEYLKKQLENNIENSKKVDRNSKRSFLLLIFMFLIAISILFFTYKTFNNSMKLSQKLYRPMLRIYGMHEKVSQLENNISVINTSLMLYNYGQIAAKDVLAKCTYYNKQELLLEKDHPTKEIIIFPQEDQSIPVNEKIQTCILENLILKVRVEYTGINDEQFYTETLFRYFDKEKRFKSIECNIDY